MTTSLSPIRIVGVISGEDSDTAKSTTVRHVVRPALTKIAGACHYYLVEREDKEKRRIGEGESMKLPPDRLDDLILKATKDRVMKRSAVFEIGAGQSDKTLAKFASLKGAIELADLMVFPVRPGQKVDKIVETIVSYLAAGFDPKKLAITYNMLEPGKTAADMWASPLFTTPIASLGISLVDHAAKWGYRLIGNGIPSSDAIRKLRELPDFTIGALAKGDVDFEAEAAKLWEAGKEAEGDEMFQLRLLAMGAASVMDHIDPMVRELFGINDPSFSLAA